MSDDIIARLRASRSTWENARGVPSDLESDAADHIDAQAATIKALVEAGTDLLGAIDMLMPNDGPAKLRMRAALAAAKQPPK